MTRPGDVDRTLNALPGLSTLVDPVRRRLYEHVTGQCGPVSREAAAAATGIARPLAAYHLDKLTEAGLLEADYARPGGRGGPGAGRPAKRYVRADRELSVTVPARDYLLVADMLAAAVTADKTGAALTAAAGLAHQTGRTAIGDDDLGEALRKGGYEPARTQDGDVELRNCPFHQLARGHPDLVCALNLHLIEGMLEGAGEPTGRAELTPSAGRCCVLIHQPATS